MNILLLPEGVRRSRNTSFSHRHVVAMALVGLVFLPIFFGVLIFEIQTLLARHHGADAGLLAAQQRELHALRNALSHTQAHTETHLNALAQRLGRMQAQVLRLNALGTRLTQMAKLDPEEFDFAELPAMGGPETVALTADNADFVKTLRALESLAETLDRRAEGLIALESLLLDRQVTAAATPSGWPATGGWVSSGFGLRADPFTGRRAYHEGVDIAARMGTDIKAMGDGVVAYAGPKTGYGLMVELTHGQGYSTRYAHTAETLVKVGDRITKGQLIARVGSSGRSTGPHLHFEVIRGGRKVDPRQYLVWEARQTAVVRR